MVVYIQAKFKYNAFNPFPAKELVLLMQLLQSVGSQKKSASWNRSISFFQLCFTRTCMKSQNLSWTSHDVLQADRKRFVQDVPRRLTGWQEALRPGLPMMSNRPRGSASSRMFHDVLQADRKHSVHDVPWRLTDQQEVLCPGCHMHKGMGRVERWRVFNSEKQNTAF